MMGIFNWISSVGAWALSGVRTLGNFSRFLFRLVVNLGPSFSRHTQTAVFCRQLLTGHYSGERIIRWLCARSSGRLRPFELRQ